MTLLFPILPNLSTVYALLCRALLCVYMLYSLLTFPFSLSNICLSILYTHIQIPLSIRLNGAYVVCAFEFSTHEHSKLCLQSV